MNATAVRPYSVEIETPEIAQLASTLESAGITLDRDGSVTEPDCYCDCDECEHSCDCRNCDITNGYDSPNHCGDCVANECQVPKIITAKLPGRIREALEELHEINTEDLENGGHIHINAPDLTTAQANALQRVWTKVDELLRDELIHRAPFHYCELVERNQTEPNTTDRNLAVNLTNWDNHRQRAEAMNADKFSTTYKWTVEFRQFASTANPELIERRAQLCRALVDYIADNRPTYWLFRAQTAEELLSVLEVERH